MEKEKTLSVTFRDVEITYDEQYNKWRFTLRGKDRSAESLSNAKRTIEAPPPKEEKAFRRFEAWYHAGWGQESYARATVTSIAESGRFWVTKQVDKYGRKERTQASAFDLFACESKNNAIVARLEAKRKEINVLRLEAEAIKNELRHIEPKDWEEPEPKA